MVFKYVFHGQELPRSCFAPIFLLDFFRPMFKPFVYMKTLCILNMGLKWLKKINSSQKENLIFVVWNPWISPVCVDVV